MATAAQDRVKHILVKITSFENQMKHFSTALEQKRYDAVTAEIRLGGLTQLMTDYERYNDELTVIDSSNEKLKIFFDLQDRYLSIASKVKKMQTVSSSLPEGINESICERQKLAKLPVIQIPTFDGTHEQWLSFRNTFKTMVDKRTDITDLTKFSYLKTALKGEAANKLAIFDASDENYKLAWDLLVESYERKRILASKHIKALLHLPVITKVSSTALNALHDEVRQHMTTLKSIGVTPDDTTMIEIISEKLPPTSRREWEKTLDMDTFPTLDQFYKFLRDSTNLLFSYEESVNQIQAKKRTGDNTQPPAKFKRDNSSARVFATLSNVSPCLKCKSKHYLYACPEFLQLQVQQRWNFVRENKLCRNCLRAHAGQCTSKYHCKHCEKKHHSLLHSEKRQQDSNTNQGSTNNTSAESNVPVNKNA